MFLLLKYSEERRKRKRKIPKNTHSVYVTQSKPTCRKKYFKIMALDEVGAVFFFHFLDSIKMNATKREKI